MTHAAMIARVLVVVMALVLLACGDEGSEGGDGGETTAPSDGGGGGGGDGGGGTTNNVPLGASFHTDPLQFPPAAVGSSSTMSLTLQNGHDTARRVVRLTISADPPDFQIAEHDCRQELAPGGTCSVRLIFTPSASGTRRATLRIDTEPQPGVSVPLEGGTRPSAGGLPPEDAPLDPDDGTLVDPDTGTSSEP
jgi:hypothetical protein